MTVNGHFVKCYLKGVLQMSQCCFCCIQYIDVSPYNFRPFIDTFGVRFDIWKQGLCAFVLDFQYRDDSGIRQKSHLHFTKYKRLLIYYISNVRTLAQRLLLCQYGSNIVINSIQLDLFCFILMQCYRFCILYDRLSSCFFVYLCILGMDKHLPTI